MWDDISRCTRTVREVHTYVVMYSSTVQYPYNVDDMQYIDIWFFAALSHLTKTKSRTCHIPPLNPKNYVTAIKSHCMYSYPKNTKKIEINCALITRSVGLFYWKANKHLLKLKCFQLVHYSTELLRGLLNLIQCYSYSVGTVHICSAPQKYLSYYHASKSLPSGKIRE